VTPRSFRSTPGNARVPLATPKSGPILTLRAPSSAPALPKIRESPGRGGGTPSYRDSRLRLRQINETTVVSWANFVLSPSQHPQRPVANITTLQTAVACMGEAAQCDFISEPIEKIRQSIVKDQLFVTKTVHLRSHTVPRKELMEILLLSYEPMWLLTALSLVLRDTSILFHVSQLVDLHDMVSIQQEDHRQGLVVDVIEKFIDVNLLGDNLDVEFFHQHMRKDIRNGSPRGRDQAVFNAATLENVLALILILDVSKRRNICFQDLPLFRHDSKYKSSNNVLLAVAKDLLQEQGDIVHLLRLKGYTLEYSETPISNASSLRIVNLSTDVTDGTLLFKITSLLQADSPLELGFLSDTKTAQVLRTTLRRLARLDALDGETDFDWEKCAKDFESGNIDVVLRVMWRIIWLWVRRRVMTADLPRVSDLVARLQYREQLTFNAMSSCSIHTRRAKAFDDVDIEELRLMTMNETGADARLAISNTLNYRRNPNDLLVWCTAVAAYYDIHVTDWTNSFRDGRVLCLLLHHYRPHLLSRDEISMVAVSSGREESTEIRILDDNAAEEHCHNNPQTVQNFRLFSSRAKMLCDIPPLHSSSDLIYLSSSQSEYGISLFEAFMRLIVTCVYRGVAHSELSSDVEMQRSSRNKNIIPDPENRAIALLTSSSRAYLRKRDAEAMQILERCKLASAVVNGCLRQRRISENEAIEHHGAAMVLQMSLRGKLARDRIKLAREQNRSAETNQQVSTSRLSSVIPVSLAMALGANMMRANVAPSLVSNGAIFLASRAVSVMAAIAGAGNQFHDSPRPIPNNILISDHNNQVPVDHMQQSSAYLVPGSDMIAVAETPHNRSSDGAKSQQTDDASLEIADEEILELFPDSAHSTPVPVHEDRIVRIEVAKNSPTRSESPSESPLISGKVGAPHCRQPTYITNGDSPRRPIDGELKNAAMSMGGRDPSPQQQWSDTRPPMPCKDIMAMPARNYSLRKVLTMLRLCSRTTGVTSDATSGLTFVRNYLREEENGTRQLLDIEGALDIITTCMLAYRDDALLLTLSLQIMEFLANDPSWFLKMRDFNHLILQVDWLCRSMIRLDNHLEIVLARSQRTNALFVELGLESKEYDDSRTEDTAEVRNMRTNKHVLNRLLHLRDILSIPCHAESPM
jgi:Calponin homology (CH) domain